MPTIIIPGRTAGGERPSGPFVLNRDLAKSLGIVWGSQVDGPRARCAIDPRRGTTGGTPLLRAVPRAGLGLEGDATTSRIQTFAFHADFNQPVFSLMAWVVADTAGAVQTAAAKAIHGFGSTSGSWAFGNDATTNWRMAMVVNGSQFNATVAQTLGVLTQIVVTYDGANCFIYRDFASSGTVGISNAFPSLTQDITLLGRGSGALDASSWDGTLHDIWLANKVWSVDERYQMWHPATRWGLYAQPTRRFYFQTPAAGTGIVRQMLQHHA